MTEPIPNIRPEFFGKDAFAPFIGRVEDVNDPKQGGRVKVRCIGWHPKSKKGKEGLKTDDLPWARVAMPTTYAQQGRIGGKHGLLNGSWVFGFFLDGQEAQDPVILNTFNFTPKASDEDNRKELQGQDGKDAESDGAFDKSAVSPKTNTNAAIKTVKEAGKKYGDPNDPAGDGWANDADNDACGGQKALQSRAASERQNAENTNSTPSAQKTDVLQGDGQCGSVAHAGEDVMIKIKKHMPSAMSRYTYGDAVWDRYSGKYMDLNGIMAQLAIDLCSLLKQPINSSKAFTNEINRKIKSTTILATPDRDGFIREKIEKVQSVKNDLFNGIFQTSFVDILCSLMMNMIQAMNNEEEQATGDNLTGNIGASPETKITDVEARCISQTILNNVDVMTQASIELSLTAAEEAANSEDGGASSGEQLAGALAGILGGLSSAMQFPMIFKYAMRPDVFNAAGPASMDGLTKGIGCRQDRTYNTAMGAMGSLMGAGGGGGSGGGGSNGGEGSGGAEEGSSGRGSSTSRGVERYPNVGFGGYPGETTGELTNRVCDEAYADPNDPQNAKPGGWPGQNTGGTNGKVISISLPSLDEGCAKNYINGTPNTMVVTRKGRNYYFHNPKDDKKVYPSVFIKGYSGTPVPVVEPTTGELVAVLVNCVLFDPNYPNVPVTIIPDDSEVGISTDDPTYDIVIGGFFVANTGFDYCAASATIRVYDRDSGLENGQAKPVIVDGRIVDVELINNGTGFKRIPDVKIIDDGSECGTSGGYGAKLYPIMSVVPKPDKKPAPLPVQMVYCPSKDQKNYY